MSSTDIGATLFARLVDNQSDTIPIILNYLPKCMLPELLDISSVRNAAASTILSNVNITDSVSRHENIYGDDNSYSKCKCVQFDIEPANLKRGVDQWGIYPTKIHFDGMEQFQSILENFPEVLQNARSINGSFYCLEGENSKRILREMVSSNVKFEVLKLFEFGDMGSVPLFVKDLDLVNTKLDTTCISGLQRFYSNTKKINTPLLNYSFISRLEQLSITTNTPTEVSLPQSLRKLTVDSCNGTISLSCEESNNLKELLFRSMNTKSFVETGIMAPNLKVLRLANCYDLTDFDSLKGFTQLEELSIKDTIYPIGLFDAISFPKLKSFTYGGVEDLFESSHVWLSSENLPEEFNNPILKFPPNLTLLHIEDTDYFKINLDTLVFPVSLTDLRLSQVLLSEGEIPLNENLESIFIDTPKLTFSGEFTLPKLAKKFTINADHLTFQGSRFLKELPTNLLSLSLKAYESGEMKTPVGKIKWPSSLKSLALKRFDLNHKTFKMLNLRDSKLEDIDIYKCKLEKLDVHALPTSVVDLKLVNVGIENLPPSLERLEKLKHLTLRKNRFGNLVPVKLPMKSLETINVSRCYLRAVSPLLVSMKEKRFSKTRLEITAWNNPNLAVDDVLKLLKTIKGLTVIVSRLDDDNFMIVSRLTASQRAEKINIDFHPDNPELNYLMEANLCYDSDQIYCGSEISLDDVEDENGDDYEDEVEVESDDNGEYTYYDEGELI